MADFESFFPTLLSHEGGFVNHPNDPGGATNKGITFATFKANAKALGIEPTLENLKSLTDDQAMAIYRARYWNAIRGDEIEDQAVAEQIFDFYVNAGRNAIKVLQRTVNGFGYHFDINGKIDSAVLSAVNGISPPALYREYREKRIAYYEWIATRNPKLKVFLKGWLNRANSFRSY